MARKAVKPSVRKKLNAFSGLIVSRMIHGEAAICITPSTEMVMK